MRRSGFDQTGGVSRRGFLRAAVAGLAGGSLLMGGSVAGAKPGKKPNVLFI
ncbi:MAG: twin-arginine translocation signal domain-containing protein, partial [Phycisphaerales bacterium]|nr:twin-arginine translocation signal domain-containing protein [Phycisphaerales bacterium]